MGPKTVAAVVLVSVFALGAVAGIAVHGHLGAPLHGAPHETPTSAAELHEAAMRELRVQLELTDEQIAAINAIVARRQETVQRTWEQLRPEVQEAMRDVHEEIAALLNPDQAARFHEWLLAQRQRHELSLH